MKLRDILNILEQTAHENKLSKPYIVGGCPRDMLIRKLESINDIDITCGDESSLKLGALAVVKLPGAILTTYSDKHSKLHYNNLSIDFSSNFIIPNIENIKSKDDNIVLNTDMKKELYSRDFTINTLLMPTDMSNIIDITGKGIGDINNQMVDTCLNPNITFTVDPRRIIRVFYLCSKLKFKPSNRVISWLKTNGAKINDASRGFVANKLNKALAYDYNYTLDLLKFTNVINYIPQTHNLLNPK